MAFRRNGKMILRRGDFCACCLCFGPPHIVQRMTVPLQPFSIIEAPVPVASIHAPVWYLPALCGGNDKVAPVYGCLHTDVVCLAARLSQPMEGPDTSNNGTAVLRRSIHLVSMKCFPVPVRVS